MTKTEFLVIGQGISGTWLSYYLQKAGRDFIVIDKKDPNASSHIAAGVINPVTGRRHVSTWMAEELLPRAARVYEEMGRALGLVAITKMNVIEFFPTAQMRLSFMDRLGQNSFLQPVPDENAFQHLLNYDLGCASVAPVYVVNLEGILEHWRRELVSKNRILEERFDVNAVKLESSGLTYEGIKADTIIFCDGIGGMHYPWFRNLPFAPNKGEVIFASIPGLPPEHIYKKGMVAVPLFEPGFFWIGASYEWEYDTEQPTTEFRAKADGFLKNFLKIPYEIIDHKAGIRPATLERRPFVGRHPKFRNIAILNGMGTKGCSLAPYFADQLVKHLLFDSPIDLAADINRFRKILSQ